MIMRILNRLFAFTHRWVGIVVGLVAVMWFVTGFVMMYAGGMPRLTPQARLDHLPALDLSAVKIGAARAATQSGLDPQTSGAPVLVMIQGRPAWRFPDAPPVFADDGTELAPLDVAASRQVAMDFLREPPSDIRHLGTIAAPDQWTLTLRRSLPLEKFAAGDAAHTELYVSPTSGEVVLVTTRGQRALAWLGTIPHWLYFGDLRMNQPVWYWIVVTLSALVCVLAILGMTLAILRWNPSKPFRWSRAIPFRGQMRWHYIAGSLFGLFVVTWAFSGLASMEPWDWMNVPELEVQPQAFTGGEVALGRFETPPAALAALVQPRFIKEATLQRIHGEHYWSLRTSTHQDARALPLERLHAPYDFYGRGEEDQVLVHATTLQRHDAALSTDAIIGRLRKALPDLTITDVATLTDYDDYYYSRSRQIPLPVLRVKLDDPLRTWLYIDVHTSRVVANVHRHSRVERWVYSGLHSLDFRFWYAKRPWWDLGMILLLTGGLVASVLGFWAGLRRLLRPATDP
jgi:hypothetical protein